MKFFQLPLTSRYIVKKLKFYAEFHLNEKVKHLKQNRILIKINRENF